MLRTSSLFVVTALLGSGIAAADQGPVEPLTSLEFAFDSSELSPDMKARLAVVAATFCEHPELSIILGGYADKIGTAPYNVGLSIRRAEAVGNALLAAGVDKRQIVVSAYGERGERLAGNALNRRVTVGMTRSSLATVTADALERGGTSVKFGEPLTPGQIEKPTSTVAER